MMSSFNSRIELQRDRQLFGRYLRFVSLATSAAGVPSHFSRFVRHVILEAMQPQNRHTTEPLLDCFTRNDEICMQTHAHTHTHTHPDANNRKKRKQTDSRHNAKERQDVKKCGTATRTTRITKTTTTTTTGKNKNNKRNHEV